MTDRTEPPQTGTEAEVMLGFLAWLRSTIAFKAAGLDAVALQQTHPPSSITLGGLLKHLAFVEDNWTSVVLEGNSYAEPFASADWDADPDWEWTTAADDSPDELRALFAQFTESSDRKIAAALQRGGLDTLAAREVHGEPVSLRWIMVHLIEEYARHAGHADLIRESIDGATGQ